MIALAIGVSLALVLLGCDEPGPRVKPSEVARAWASIAAPVQGVVCDLVWDDFKAHKAYTLALCSKVRELSERLRVAEREIDKRKREGSDKARRLPLSHR